MFKKILLGVVTSLVVAGISSTLAMFMSISASIARVEAKQESMDHRLDRIERTVVDSRLGMNDE